ncbi:hypothetical protein SS50377_20342 [Spironucleus salmonicida]|uniref:Uncharacterized protein n=2 Tax=Spironucleus TaxID=39709 RepID=V6LFF2_9EUKA|nr:hypothetical protein SS50377_20342 [Spironucleus salmonicida]|eukprot:EST43023.1 hypothetical protein SS50377_17326 [Spironucleus salmonicida]
MSVLKQTNEPPSLTVSGTIIQPPSSAKSNYSFSRQNSVKPNQKPVPRRPYIVTETLAVKYYKNQVYVPDNTADTVFEPVAQPKLLDSLKTLETVRDLNPELQNATEINRLLQIDQKIASQYKKIMKDRARVQLPARQIYAEQQKQSLKRCPFFYVDDTAAGREFKQHGMCLSDMQLLAGSYKMNQNSKYFNDSYNGVSKNQKVVNVKVDIQLMRQLPKVFHEKESLYEAVSNAGIIKGIKLQKEMENRQKRILEEGKMQFITEIGAGTAEEKEGGFRGEIDAVEQCPEASDEGNFFSDEG